MNFFLMSKGEDWKQSIMILTSDEEYVINVLGEGPCVFVIWSII